MVTQQLFDYLDAHRDEMVKTLSDLIACKSVRSEALPGMPFGAGCAEALDTALKLAASFGLRTDNCQNYVGTADLGVGDPALGILCHLDVVPAGEGWTSPPFCAKERGGRVYGRGAIDDKGPAVAVLYALRAFSELGIPLSGSVRLILGCDEECGSSDLAYYRAQHALPPMVFTPDGDYPVINVEKGRLQADFGCTFPTPDGTLVSVTGGTVVNAVPQTAQAMLRGISRQTVADIIRAHPLPLSYTLTEQDSGLVIRAEGKSAHASTPHLGINALSGLITLLTQLPLAESPQLDALRAVAALFPFQETDGTGVGLFYEDDISGALTLAFSLFTLDAHGMRGSVDIRFPVSMTLAQVTQQLCDALDGRCLSLLEAEGSEPHSVSADSPLVRTLLRVYEQVTGEPGYPLAIGGGTYVHDIPGGVAFGAEFPGEDNHMHGADESIAVDSLVKNAKLFAAAIYELCK